MTDEGKLEYPNKAYFPNPMGLLCGVGGGEYLKLKQW